MAQLQSTCVLGTLAISASNANAQQAIMIGGASNNAEFTNQCNLIAIGENTALSGSGGLNPNTINVTQEGTNFTTGCYNYYQASFESFTGKPSIVTGGGGSGASFGGRVQPNNYAGPGNAGDVMCITVGCIGSGFTSTATVSICDPFTTGETCEIFTIEPFTNENSINIGHNAGCKAQGENTIRIGSSAGKGNLSNGIHYQLDSIAIGANTMLSGSYENSIAIGHNALKGCNTCTSYNRCIINTTVVGSNSLQNASCRILDVTVVGACNVNNTNSACNATVIGRKNAECIEHLGSSNTIIGFCNATATGTQKSICSGNTIIGSNNLLCSALANFNTVIGYNNIRTGCVNFGQYNTAIGANNLWSITTGDYNVAIGCSAGICNTTGYSNVYLGNGSGRCNCTGGNSVYIGPGAGCGMRNLNDSVFIGAYTGRFGCNTQGGHVSIGPYALQAMSSGYFNTAIGYCTLSTNGCSTFQSSCWLSGGYNIAIGPYAGRYNKTSSQKNLYIGHAMGPTSLITESCKFCLGMDGGNALLIGCLASTGRTLGICGTLSKTAGSFQISHPDPAKTQIKDLWHSFVESPTAGDNLYRFEVEIENGTATIDLPDYYKHLNENDQVWVNAKNHFGRAYGVVNQEQTVLTVFADTDGEYNVLLIGTRKDEDAVKAWKGTERLK